jgi:uncharacterized protein YjbJ (UPF0337 family)
MDKDRVKGKVDELVGSAKRHVGNLTGDNKTKIEGAVQQVKGKAENTWGKVKDAARDAHDQNKAVHAENKEAAREDREALAAEDRNII